MVSILKVSDSPPPPGRSTNPDRGPPPWRCGRRPHSRAARALPWSYMAIPQLASAPPPRLRRRRAAAPSRASLRGETQLAAFWASRPRPRLGSAVCQRQQLATAAGARAELAWCRWGGGRRFHTKELRGGGRRGGRSMGRGCRARPGGASVVGSAGAARERGGAALAARLGGRRGALSQVAARRVLEAGWGGGDRPRGGHLARGAYWGGRLGGGGPLADGAPRAAPSEGGENGRVGGASAFALVCESHFSHTRVRLEP